VGVIGRYNSHGLFLMLCIFYARLSQCLCDGTNKMLKGSNHLDSGRGINAEYINAMP